MQILLQKGKGRHHSPHPRDIFAHVFTRCFTVSLTYAFIFLLFDVLVLKMSHALAVLDPDPTLQETKFIGPAKTQLHFCSTGQNIASTYYIHMRVLFNFTQMLEIPSSISATYKNYTKTYPEMFKTQLYFITKISVSCQQNGFRL
jgi:hypothetical protein